ncbi:MAG: hypothetical protein JST54_13750 [Deltaproteobacteria bacterium]|nr:hypothetical protein [Deltaproteobacteria bacterium]
MSTVERAAMRVVGLGVRTTNAAEMKPETAKLGAHWGRVPAGKFRRFEAVGEMPAALIRTWGEIWHFYENGPHERAYSVDLEIHDPAKPDRVEIFIAEK